MYGNLATIIMVMVVVYLYESSVIYGAEINAYFEKEFGLHINQYRTAGT